MTDVHWWFAVGLGSSTTMVFVVSMFAFFRRMPGVPLQRVALLTGIVVGLCVIFVPLLRRDTVDPPTLAIGALLLMLAQALFWSAVLAHGSRRPSAAFTTRAPEVLTVRGPYRWIRHPFYVAYVLGFAGGAAFAGSGWAWAVPLWMGALYAAAARQEERLILASPLATAYREYSRTAGAFVPRLVKAASGGDRAASNGARS